jgi:hypothetical protein
VNAAKLADHSCTISANTQDQLPEPGHILQPVVAVLRRERRPHTCALWYPLGNAVLPVTAGAALAVPSPHSTRSGGGGAVTGVDTDGAPLHPFRLRGCCQPVLLGRTTNPISARRSGVPRAHLARRHASQCVSRPAWLVPGRAARLAPGRSRRRRSVREVLSRRPIPPQSRRPTAHHKLCPRPGDLGSAPDDQRALRSHETNCPHGNRMSTPTSSITSRTRSRGPIQAPPPA